MDESPETREGRSLRDRGVRSSPWRGHRSISILKDPEGVAAAFDIAPQLAREVVYYNDEHFDRSTPEDRWNKMRAWVAGQIKQMAEEQQ